MWALFPLSVGHETADSSVLSAWTSPEQQQYSLWAGYQEVCFDETVLRR